MADCTRGALKLMQLQTVIALTTFVLAMVLYPEAQALVQEEIDRVVGRDRLPEVDDQKFLPCVTAVMYEVLRRVQSIAHVYTDFAHGLNRWHSPIPLGSCPSYIAHL